MQLITYARVFLVTGLIFGFIQNRYYGQIDESGVIQDSLFLPLSFMFVTTGLGLFAFIFARYIYKKCKG